MNLEKLVRNGRPGPHCFTSFNYAYLAKAKVLAESIRRHNPDWNIWALLVDEPPPGVHLSFKNSEFDFVYNAKHLPIPSYLEWIFGHNVVEACTAVKGSFARELLAAGASKVVYLDPDIAVFSSLKEVETLLDAHDILLTPHQLEPDHTEPGIIDNEIGSLKHGCYNLGFFALRSTSDGHGFARWWAERLVRYCRDDIPNGLFTDQRWCDLAPCFFAGTKIVREPGWNVASWNLSRRRIAFGAGGELLVNDKPLRFFHFTKLGPVGETMTTRYAADCAEVFELWSWYRIQVANAVDPAFPTGYWKYGSFDDGTPIPGAARVLYRGRADLRRAFPHPFASGPGSYQEWCSANLTTV